MNKKTIIISSVVIFIVVILLGAGYFFLNQNKVVSPGQVSPAQTDSTIPTPEPNPTLKLNPPPQPTTDSKINIFLKNNVIVAVSNFYKDPETKVFSVEQDAVIKDEPQYKIIYYTVDQSFFIFLLGGDLKTVRTTAEQELLKKIGVAENQACGLRVSVMIDAGVNDGGVDYKLSFCPNGKPLP